MYITNDRYKFFLHVLFGNEQNPYIASNKVAYRDLCRTLRFGAMGGEEYRKHVDSILENRVNNILTRENHTQDDFDEWHQSLCVELVEYYTSNGVITVIIVISIVASAASITLAEENTYDLTGHWASAEFGRLDFIQNGTSFTATWTGVSVSGTITGNKASFAYWQGRSFDACKNEQRGHGTLTVSDNGNNIEGNWRNMDKEDTSSGYLTQSE